MFNNNLTTTIKKVDDLDIVVEAKVDSTGKIISQVSYTKEQVEKMKESAVESNTKAVERFNSLLEVFI